MKNQILLWVACAAFVMTGSVKAQITVNSSQVEISKPLSVKHIETTGSLQLDLGTKSNRFKNVWAVNPEFLNGFTQMSDVRYKVENRQKRGSVKHN